MDPQGLHSIALGGMMAGGDVVDPQLTGDMEGWLRDLATDIGIQPQRRGLFDIALGPTAAPADAADGVVATLDQ